MSGSDSALIDQVSSMSEDEIDALPIGVITLALDGTIQRYNQMEAQLARLDKHRQIGKHFFRDVAPCTANPEFQGRFEALTQKSSGVENFDYVFRFAWGHQRVHITFVRKADVVDVLVTRLGA